MGGANVDPPMHKLNAGVELSMSHPHHEPEYFLLGPFLASHEPLFSEASRSGFLAKWLFGGLGYQGQETTHVQGKSVLFGLAAEDGKANKSVCA